MAGQRECPKVEQKFTPLASYAALNLVPYGRSDVGSANRNQGGESTDIGAHRTKQFKRLEEEYSFGVRPTPSRVSNHINVQAVEIPSRFKIRGSGTLQQCLDVVPG